MRKPDSEDLLCAGTAIVVSVFFFFLISATDKKQASFDKHVSAQTLSEQQQSNVINRLKP